MSKVKHGGYGTKLYSVYHGIKSRCYNKNNIAYYRYGGRGIKLCDEWFDFVVFRTWALANGYKEGLSIDRIDNNGNYESSNCQWITLSLNAAKANTKEQRPYLGDGRAITSKVNVRKAQEANRSLSSNQIHQLRNLFSKGISRKELASMFGVRYDVAKSIVAGSRCVIV